MEYLKKVLKKSGWAAILESIIFAILGIVLIANKEETLKFISYILGISFIFIGAYKIINYIQEKGNNDIFNYELIYGIMAIIIGIITMVYSSTIGAIFRIIIGVWIIYSAVVRGSSALKLKTSTSKLWIGTLIIAIAMFICGLYITLNAGAVIEIIGTLMIIYAVMDIIENIILLNHIKNIN